MTNSFVGKSLEYLDEIAAVEQHHTLTEQSSQGSNRQPDSDAL